jgi:hypothetical protein
MEDYIASSHVQTIENGCLAISAPIGYSAGSASEHKSLRGRGGGAVNHQQEGGNKKVRETI